MASVPSTQFCCWRMKAARQYINQRVWLCNEILFTKLGGQIWILGYGVSQPLYGTQTHAPIPPKCPCPNLQNLLCSMSKGTLQMWIKGKDIEMGKLSWIIWVGPI